MTYFIADNKIKKKTLRGKKNQGMIFLWGNSLGYNSINIINLKGNSYI